MAENGIKISSSMTMAYKKLLPLYWTAIMIWQIAIRINIEHKTIDIDETLSLLLIVSVGAYITFFFTYRFANKVFDCGKYLLIQNRGKTIELPLSEIEDIDYKYSFFGLRLVQRIPRVKITTKNKTPLGSKIIFCAEYGNFFMFPVENPRITALIERIRNINKNKRF